MGKPSLATYWRGHMPTTDEPGANRLLRTITASSSSYVEIDLRSAGYAGAVDGIAQDADGEQHHRRRASKGGILCFCGVSYSS
jgi:hypothetical protein